MARVGALAANLLLISCSVSWCCRACSKQVVFPGWARNSRGWLCRYCSQAGHLDVTADWGIIRCLAGFFFGMLIFQFTRKDSSCQSRMFIRICEIAVMIAIILMMSFTSGPLIVFVIPLFVIAIALLQSDQGPVARLLISPVAQFLGRISYSIYMVHSFLVVCLLIILKRVFVLPTAINPIRPEPDCHDQSVDWRSPGSWVIVVVVAAASATYVSSKSRVVFSAVDFSLVRNFLDPAFHRRQSPRRIRARDT